MLDIITMQDAQAWPNMDLLLDLDVLLEERHVTHAAKRRGITQSAMSARLSKLREFFSDPLLVDARPRLLPTARAEALRGPLRKALGELSNLMNETAAFDPITSTRTFVLVGGDAAEAIAVPRLLAKFRDQAPGIKLQMRRPSADLQIELGERGADLAFEPMSNVPTTLRALPVLHEAFVVMMRAGHPLAGKRLTLSQYLAQSHILIAPAGLPGGIVDDALAELGKTRYISAILRHFTSAPIVVARSDALLTCPSWLADAVAGLMPITTTDVPLKLPTQSVGAVWHERVHQDPAHVWLRSTLKSVLVG